MCAPPNSRIQKLSVAGIRRGRSGRHRSRLDLTAASILCLESFGQPSAQSIRAAAGIWKMAPREDYIAGRSTRISAKPTDRCGNPKSETVLSLRLELRPDSEFPESQAPSNRLNDFRMLTKSGLRHPWTNERLGQMAGLGMFFKINFRGFHKLPTCGAVRVKPHGMK